MNRLLLAWFVFCVSSLMLYGFTGVPLWSKLTAPDDVMRALCLMAFYIAGLTCYPISRMP